MDSAVALVQSRLLRAVLALALAATLLLTVMHLAPPEHRWRILGQETGDKAKGPMASPGRGHNGTTAGAIPSCGSTGNRGSTALWNEAQARYSALRDDKFTIALQTYHREKELNETLRALLDTQVPSLLEVVVVWNNVETQPPANYVSALGVPVRYRHSRHNSLNEKLWPDPAFRTQAVLLSDDDVYYHADDLEFVFQTWRKFGRHRVTGALARCATPRADGTWIYGFCSDGAEPGAGVYSMILTNLAFAHMALMDYYSSADPVARKLRAYVDEHFNCEDIALNYVASLLTGDGPLLVTGRRRYTTVESPEGISKKPHHLEARSRCLYDLADMFGCMPLVDETAYVQRGVVVL